jgi:hypothetical protein
MAIVQPRDALCFFAGHRALQIADISRFDSAIHPAGLTATKGGMLLDRPKIAELLLKHADKLPWAKSMPVCA